MVIFVKKVTTTKLMVLKRPHKSCRKYIEGSCTLLPVVTESTHSSKGIQHQMKTHQTR